jgi:hypothetical protein
MHLLGERAWWRRGAKEDPQPPTKRVDEPRPTREVQHA